MSSLGLLVQFSSRAYTPDDINKELNFKLAKSWTEFSHTFKYIPSGQTGKLNPLFQLQSYNQARGRNYPKQLEIRRCLYMV